MDPLRCNFSGAVTERTAIRVFFAVNYVLKARAERRAEPSIVDIGNNVYHVFIYDDGSTWKIEVMINARGTYAKFGYEERVS